MNHYKNIFLCNEKPQTELPADPVAELHWPVSEYMAFTGKQYQKHLIKKICANTDNWKGVYDTMGNETHTWNDSNAPQTDAGQKDTIALVKKIGKRLMLYGRISKNAEIILPRPHFQNIP